MPPKIFFIFGLLIIAAFTLQCSDSNLEPELPNFTLAELLDAPSSIIFSNKTLILSTNIWRDFQSESPPDGDPLIALAFVETADKSEMPKNISADAIYIVYQDEIWKSYFSDEEPAPDLIQPYRIVDVARDGPKWGPNIYVNVIVRINYGEEWKLLQAPSQYVHQVF